MKYTYDNSGHGNDNGKVNYVAKLTIKCHNSWVFGISGMEWWNGMLEWNSGME